MRPGIAFAYQDTALPKKLPGGRSVRIVVTMEMPAFACRWLFFSHAIHALNRNIPGFVGFRPIRTTFFGMVENAKEQRRQNRLARMRVYGTNAK